MLDLGLGSIEDFPFLEPPDGRVIADGWQQLHALGAVDQQRQLSAIGRQMARLPVDAKPERRRGAACAHGCLRETKGNAAILGLAEQRERSARARRGAEGPKSSVG